MPAGLFERYVGEMDALEAEWLLDIATAVDYAGWDKRARERWWSAQERRIRRQPRFDGPIRRTSLFFWAGQPISPDALKANVSRQLGGRLLA